VGLVRTIGRRVARRVASIVSRNELFERHGDRPMTPPLAHDAWSPESEESSDEPDDEAHCRTASLDAVMTAMKAGPLVVNHWATWCEPCVSELPVLKELKDRTSVPLLGVSWDTFEGGQADEMVTQVASFMREQELHWPTLVVDAKPSAFFKRLDIDWEKVPQTWLIDSNGAVVHKIEGVVEQAHLADLIARVEAL
jgi:thiol-disulfide isomerase/thioredoxin